MINDPVRLLGEATVLATLLVDQIQYVDVLDPVLSAVHQRPVREDGAFCQDATAFLSTARQRTAVKRIVEGIARKVRGNELMLRMLDPEEVCAACELVTSAVKGLLAGQAVHDDDAARLKRQRLVLKFESIESPWIQDPSYRGELVT